MVVQHFADLSECLEVLPLLMNACTRSTCSRTVATGRCGACAKKSKRVKQMGTSIVNPPAQGKVTCPAVSGKGVAETQGPWPLRQFRAKKATRSSLECRNGLEFKKASFRAVSSVG